MQLGGNRRRNDARTSAAIAAGDRHVLLAVDAERDGESLHRCAEPGFPENLSRFHFERPAPAVEVSGECEATSRCHGRGHEGRALLVRPQLLHRAYVKCRESADVAVRAWHFIEAPAGAAPAAA